MKRQRNQTIAKEMSIVALLTWTWESFCAYEEEEETGVNAGTQAITSPVESNVSISFG